MEQRFFLESKSPPLFLASQEKFQAIGDSMMPYLTHGQEISVSPCGKRLVPGQCYLFYHQGRLMLHRLVFFTRHWAFFLGDNGVWVEKVPRNMVFAELDHADDVLALCLIAVTNLVYCFLVKIGLYSDVLGTIRRKWLGLWLKGENRHERTL